MGTLMVLHLLILITMYKSSSLILIMSTSVSLAVVVHGDHAATSSSGGGGLRIDPITQIGGVGVYPMDYDNNRNHCRDRYAPPEDRDRATGIMPHGIESIFNGGLMDHVGTASFAGCLGTGCTGDPDMGDDGGTIIDKPQPEGRANHHMSRRLVSEQPPTMTPLSPSVDPNDPPNPSKKKSFVERVHDPNDPPNTYNKKRFVERVNDPNDPTNTYKKKRFVERVYEALFRVTHARLHPVHYRPTRVIVVDQSGRGNSRTVQGAIDMVKLDNKWRIQIIIKPGVYREKVHVPARKPFITFQGSGSAKTVITWNARASDRGQSGGILGTFDSASVAIDSDYFVARDITFQNTAPKPLPGAQGMQAVALRISGDKAAFVDCRILGAQDTLFDHMGRHFFLRCYIEGAIDFIFGDGRSLYLNCELHANAVSYGAIAASQRNGIEENTGFSFVQCRVTGTGLLYLGRAWGQYARIVFAYCYFDDIIIPDAWYDWGDTSRRETVFFGEYKCWGPGAQPRWRVSWSRQLSYAEARPFLGIGFINGHKWFNILT